MSIDNFRVNQWSWDELASSVIQSEEELRLLNNKNEELQAQVAQLVEALEKIAVEIKRYQSFPLIVNPYDTTTIIKMILVEALEAAKGGSDET